MSNFKIGDVVRHKAGTGTPIMVIIDIKTITEGVKKVPNGQIECRWFVSIEIGFKTETFHEEELNAML